MGLRGVAQLVEHRSPKPRVAGSNPVSPAKHLSGRLYHSTINTDKNRYVQEPQLFTIKYVYYEYTARVAELADALS